MAERVLDTGEVAFQAEGRLLQELGERLVASPEVALVELIKNAYDADASLCAIELIDKGKTLLVKDDGQGMSLDAFKSRWMRIATSHKLKEQTSSKFRRKLTGQKGIGRFAVRFLGRQLELDSVAWDEERGCKTRLEAEFIWGNLDKSSSLNKAQVPYRLLRVSDTTPTGTRLIVKKLKNDGGFVSNNKFRSGVLGIVSPISGLDGGRFTDDKNSKKRDPGFKVTLPGEQGDKKQEELNIAADVLKHAWARLSITHTGTALKYRVILKHGEGPPKRLDVQVKSQISRGFVADIRFFPRRPGIFRDIGVDGNKAWSWVRENQGVAVVDHGFRITPYGFEDDDWLAIAADKSHNERDWRSPISVEHFPIPPTVRARPGDNPALNLPSNFQLVGAVFIESTSSANQDESEDLIPSMDREGLLNNNAFRQLRDIVRGGIEFLALCDKEEQQREAERVAKEQARRTRADFRAAIKQIETSPSLARVDKARIIKEYAGLAERLTEVEDYNKEARRKLEIMSSLGAVAAFMTHEALTIKDSLAKALGILRQLKTKHPDLIKTVEVLERSYGAFDGQIEYTRTFIDSVHADKVVSFSAASQVRRIMAKFGNFSLERDIEVRCEVDDKVITPKMPVAVYSGILLNLYTNALKALLSSKNALKAPLIVFRAENNEKWHVLEVLDNGIGIPENIRSRVWDPLFTTTSAKDSPLGSSMGLGLTLVKQLVEQRHGRISIVDPPVGFSTCFRVEFPRDN